MAKMIDAVAAGHICLDITPVFASGRVERVGDLLKPGKLVNTEPARISLGGPVANTGLALKRYGLRLAAAAGIGEDKFGHIARELLEEAGIGGAIRPVGGACTSYTVVLAPPGIDRIFLHCPGRNDEFQLDDIDFATVAAARLFHFGYPPLMRGVYENDGRLLTAIFERAKACDATTSLDLSLPDPDSASGKVDWAGILARTLPAVDIFMPSIEELYFMLERERYLELRRRHPDADLVELIPVEDYLRLAERAIALGCGLCVIKTARRGYYLRGGSPERLARFGGGAGAAAERWAHRQLWAHAYHVRAIASATGSGDSSIAGFLAAFLRELPPERCMCLANASGHHNLLALDALSGLPDWDGLVAFVDRMPRAEDPLLEGSEFRFDEQLQVYVGPRNGRAA
ncbi:MAG TPA: carbohydrate kinase family protein [Candidatus Sumerlaeota bacterium]|nr:MAG: putative sugar kinase YdjH [candidate division BRC1 bacterium ADurb.BinA292]HOE97674.1 carbohydrate kinase family protein [Candidatus Sumerlaeota bacterium]